MMYSNASAAQPNTTEEEKENFKAGESLHTDTFKENKI